MSKVLKPKANEPKAKPLCSGSDFGHWTLDFGLWFVDFGLNYLKEPRAVSARVARRHTELLLYVVLAHLRIGHRTRHHVHFNSEPPQ